MKTKIIFLVGMLIYFAQISFGQNYQYTVLSGDTVILNASVTHGELQWQVSSDSTIWSNIVGATQNNYAFQITISPTNKWYYRLEIVDTLCANLSPSFSSVVCCKLISSTNEVQVGDWFHGGIVFFIDSSGGGLIAPPFNQVAGDSTTFEWGCCTASIPSAWSKDDGAANTAAIVAYHDNLVNYYGNPGQCSLAIFPNDGSLAAKLCDTLTLFGYNDWFLPAINQLIKLGEQKDIVGGFNGDLHYWSSTEDSIPHTYYVIYTIYEAWFIHINNVPGTSPKVRFKYYVRAIRQFNLSESNGKTICTAIVENQPTAINISSEPSSQNVCFGESSTMEIVCTGSTPLTYQWYKNAQAISGETFNTITITDLSNSDEGNYYCEISNACGSINSNEASLKVISIVADAGLNTTICSGQSSNLQATASSNYPAISGTLNYIWSPSYSLSNAFISNPIANPDSTTNYTIIISDSNGCNKKDSVLILVKHPFQDQELCFITIDPISKKNKILWEKVPDVGTAAYLICKESSTSQFDSIGIVSYDSISAFIDYYSQPEVKAEKYKIIVVDSCGNESQQSFYHKTMKLNILVDGNVSDLSLTPYKDESGSFIPPYYIIYKGTTPEQMDSIEYLPGGANENVLYYTDPNAAGNYYYKVGIKRDFICNVEGQDSLIEPSSNLVQNFPESVEGINFNKGISVYPNPTSDIITVKLIEKENLEKIKNIEIKDLTGKTVKTYNNIYQNEYTFYIDHLNSGFYIIEAIANVKYRTILIKK